MVSLKKRQAIRFMFVVLAVLILFAGCQEKGEEQAEIFKIGVIPALSGDEFQVAIEALEERLDAALPQKVEITIYPNYNGVVEALNYGHLHMAYLGPRTYVMANHQSDAQAIITQLINGEPYYNSYIITHVDNPWNTLDELLENVQDRTFTFGSITSTSGSLVPAKALKDLGVYTDEQTYAFKEVRFSGSHDLTGIAVESKHVDAGAIDSAFYYSLIEQGNLDESKLKVIWQSEPLFQYPWSVANDVSEETIQLLIEAFLAIDDQVILDGFGATGFTTATDADYEIIRQLMIEEGEIK